MTDEDPQNDQNTSLKKTVLETHGFTVGNLIGSGTYAKVKIAFSEEFKCYVAVKIISKTRAPREYLLKFLPREIDVVRGLRHENLIRFYQSIETTHRVYLIMQYAENGSLLDLIRKHGHLTEDVARKYFKQLTSAVDYCHSQGVVHRDIKCENLLLDRNYDLKIIDFGFARKNMKPINNKAVMSETYCGSYAYASPEVLRGSMGIPYDPRFSDSWATGVVLFAMVFGRLPFDGSNYHHLVKQVQSKVVFPKSPEVSASCKNLIQKILAPLKIRLSIRLIRREPWVKEPIQPTSQTTTVSSKTVASTQKQLSKKSKSIESVPVVQHTSTKAEGSQSSEQQRNHQSSVSVSSNVAETTKSTISDADENENKDEQTIPTDDSTNQIYSSTKLESISIETKKDESDDKEKFSGNEEIRITQTTMPPIILVQSVIVETTQIVSEPTKINGETTKVAETAVNLSETLVDETGTVLSTVTEEDNKIQEEETQNVLTV